MIAIKQKKDCCGCGACAQACPKNCISMIPDEEGFLYPSVDGDRCVGCGLCEKVCPLLNKATACGTVDAYAAYAKDADIREESSSGGIFTLLAQWVLDRGGAVFGAAFAEDFSVRHIMVENAAELALLRGSKYTQSAVGDAYRQAKTLLDRGRTVLFSGTECQIAGLKSFLGKAYPNLYTVDVLCHGVPSPKVWKRYLSDMEEKAAVAVRRVTFRSKETGWKSYSVKLYFDDNTVCRETGGENEYMRLFLSDICLRPSCHSCKFKDIPRSSDFTLGDAWGIDSLMPEMDDDKGTSVVLVNTERGRALWNEITPQMVLKKGDPDALLAPNGAAKKSVRLHPKRERFFAALNRGESMARLRKLSERTPLRKALSFGKRYARKLLEILGLLPQKRR